MLEILVFQNVIPPMVDRGTPYSYPLRLNIDFSKCYWRTYYTRGDNKLYPQKTEKKMSAKTYRMSRRGDLPQNASNSDSWVCPSKGGTVICRSEWRQLDGMLKSWKASHRMPATDVFNFTRPGPRNRSGEAKHGILLPERGLLRPSKSENFE